MPESAEPGVRRVQPIEGKSSDGKSEERRLAKERPSQPGVTELKSPKPQAMVQTEMPTRMQPRKRRGRLTHDTLVKLGKVLGDYYEHVRQQEVPDYITTLVERYEERKDKG